MFLIWQSETHCDFLNILQSKRHLFVKYSNSLSVLSAKQVQHLALAFSPTGKDLYATFPSTAIDRNAFCYFWSAKKK